MILQQSANNPQKSLPLSSQPLQEQARTKNSGVVAAASLLPSQASNNHAKPTPSLTKQQKQQQHAPVPPPKPQQKRRLRPCLKKSCSTSSMSSCRSSSKRVHFDRGGNVLLTGEPGGMDDPPPVECSIHLFQPEQDPKVLSAAFWNSMELQDNRMDEHEEIFHPEKGIGPHYYKSLKQAYLNITSDINNNNSNHSSSSSSKNAMADEISKEQTLLQYQSQFDMARGLELQIYPDARKFTAKHVCAVLMLQDVLVAEQVKKQQQLLLQASAAALETDQSISSSSTHSKNGNKKKNSNKTSRRSAGTGNGKSGMESMRAFHAQLLKEASLKYSHPNRILALQLAKYDFVDSYNDVPDNQNQIHENSNHRQQVKHTKSSSMATGVSTSSSQDAKEAGTNATTSKRFQPFSLLRNGWGRVAPKRTNSLPMSKAAADLLLQEQRQKNRPMQQLMPHREQQRLQHRDATGKQQQQQQQQKPTNSREPSCDMSAPKNTTTKTSSSNSRSAVPSTKPASSKPVSVHKTNSSSPLQSSSTAAKRVVQQGDAGATQNLVPNSNKNVSTKKVGSSGTFTATPTAAIIPKANAHALQTMEPSSRPKSARRFST